MLSRCIKWLLFVLFICGNLSYGQIFKMHRDSYDIQKPLPFPSCPADNIDCLRRGLRTFFILMDSGHLGMRPVDPTVVNSVVVSLPEQRVSVLLRRANVTGAKWTQLVDRRFQLRNFMNGVIFNSDLHVEGEILMSIANRTQPRTSYITMDIQEVESNITYSWSGTNYNNEDYILLGPERIAVRNRRTPTYFLQPDKTTDARIIDNLLQLQPSILDHFTNEIVSALMHTVVENFRLFANKVPVKYYYDYSSFVL